MRKALLGLALVVTSAGCMLDVDIQHTGHPEGAFTAARKAAAGVEGQEGRATEVHVLVYDPKEGELVRVEVPFWLATKFVKEGGEDKDVPPSAAKGMRLALEQAGKGTIVEVEEDSGEQVLVWLS